MVGVPPTMAATLVGGTPTGILAKFITDGFKVWTV